MIRPSSDIRSIDQYIQEFPKEIQAILSEMRSTIQRAAVYEHKSVGPFFLKHSGIIAEEYLVSTMVHSLRP